MNKFKQKLFQFMYGRYGVDQLYYGLFVLLIVLVVINTFAQSVAVYALELIVMAVMVFRSFSKNHAKRRAENAAFLKLWKPVKGWFILQRDRIRDRKDYRYRKCPKCKAMLKLPNKKGKHTTNCPRCKNKFDVKIL